MEAITSLTRLSLKHLRFASLPETPGVYLFLQKGKPVYMITAGSDPVKYYSKKIKVNELTLLRQGFGGQVGFEKEIIVIPYAAEIYGLDYKSLLTNNGYLLKKETSFREVTYEEWSKSY